MPQLNVDFTPPENNSLTSGSHLRGRKKSKTTAKAELRSLNPNEVANSRLLPPEPRQLNYIISIVDHDRDVLRRVMAYPREKASRAFLDLFENVVPAHGFEAGRAGVIEAGRAGVNDEEFLLRVWEGVTHGVWRQ